MVASLPYCFLIGKLRKDLEDKRVCLLLFLVSATKRKLCSFTLSFAGEQSSLLYSSTMNAKVEESHIRLVTNFTVLFATISMKCRTTVHTLNLLNKRDCILDNAEICCIYVHRHIKEL